MSQPAPAPPQPDPPARRSVPVAVPTGVASADPLVFFGGSFDPPHTGHARLPFEVANLRWPGQPARVVFVPAARSPHKADPPAPDHHRIEMLRLALQSRRNWWIWEQELADAPLNPGQPSYWADTWAVSSRVFGARDRAFLIGVDQAESMHRWVRFRVFWSDALVMLRADDITDSEFARRMRATGAWTASEIDHWVSRLVRTPLTDASSTAVRAALADPAQRNARIEAIDPGVQRYIAAKGLYTSA